MKTKTKKFLLSLALSLFVTALFAQTCDCNAHYEWAKEVFETNDAGFPDALQKKGQDAYKLHNTLIKKEINAISDLHQCIKILRKWVYFFRKNHVDIVNINTPPNSKDVRSHTVDLDDFKKYLSDKKTHDLEGIWDFAGKEILFKKVNNQYLGIVNKSTDTVWKKHEVQFIINEDGKGDFFNWEKSKWHLKKYELLSKDLLKINSNLYLRRTFLHTEKNSKKIEQFITQLDADTPSANKINNDTYYIRIPSFDPSQKNKIDSIILLHKNQVIRTKNLIIDIRSNGGGADKSYQELLPIIYTNPIRKAGFEFLSTELNNQRTLDFIKGSIGELNEDELQEYKSNYNILSENLGEYVNFEKPEKVKTILLDEVYVYPEKVAILVDDEVASSAEEFLLASKQSRKVKIYGIPTMGALDASNQYYTLSPDKEVILVYTLSRRINNMPIDDIGIQPDVFLDKSIPRYEWIEFVTDSFKNP